RDAAGWHGTRRAHPGRRGRREDRHGAGGRTEGLEPQGPGQPRSRLVHRLRARRVADHRARRAGRARRRRRRQVRRTHRQADSGALLHPRRGPATWRGARSRHAPAAATPACARSPPRRRRAGGPRGSPLRFRVRFERRLWTPFEWALPLLAIAICAFGILTVYSASYTPGADSPAPMAIRQLTWFAAGLLVMLGMLGFDYRKLERHAYLIYLVVLLLVLAVPLVGQGGGGARRWVRASPRCGGSRGSAGGGRACGCAPATSRSRRRPSSVSAKPPFHSCSWRYPPP